MNLYLIADKVADKTSSIFEAANHKVMARNLSQRKELMDRKEEYSMYQIGILENAGQAQPTLHLEWKTWTLTEFMNENTYTGE